MPSRVFLRACTDCGPGSYVTTVTYSGTCSVCLFKSEHALRVRPPPALPHEVYHWLFQVGTLFAFDWLYDIQSYKETLNLTSPWFGCFCFLAVVSDNGVNGCILHFGAASLVRKNFRSGIAESHNSYF